MGFYEIIDIVTGFSTLFLVIATFLYFYQTKKLVKENKEMRESMNRPKIIVNYELHEGKGGIFDFVIKNVGNSPAKEIRLELENDLKCYGEEKYLSETKIFKDGIDYMVPNQEIKRFLNFTRQMNEEEFEKIYRGNITYKDVNGKTYKEKFSLDFSYLSDLKYIEEKKIKDILKDISKDINKISKSFKN